MTLDDVVGVIKKEFYTSVKKFSDEVFNNHHSTISGMSKFNEKDWFNIRMSTNDLVYLLELSNDSETEKLVNKVLLQQEVYLIWNYKSIIGDFREKDDKIAYFFSVPLSLFINFQILDYFVSNFGMPGSPLGLAISSLVIYYGANLIHGLVQNKKVNDTITNAVGYSLRDIVDTCNNMLLKCQEAELDIQDKENLDVIQEIFEKIDKDNPHGYNPRLSAFKRLYDLFKIPPNMERITTEELKESIKEQISNETQPLTDTVSEIKERKSARMLTT